jgi:hypothetical protein
MWSLGGGEGLLWWLGGRKKLLSLGGRKKLLSLGGRKKLLWSLVVILVIKVGSSLIMYLCSRSIVWSVLSVGRIVVVVV